MQVSKKTLAIRPRRPDSPSGGSVVYTRSGFTSADPNCGVGTAGNYFTGPDLVKSGFDGEHTVREENGVSGKWTITAPVGGSIYGNADLN